jgi:1-acyl-sn-glycerol-3-phosphate acyltransferase
LHEPGGPVLFAANHPSRLDSLLLPLVLPGDNVVLLPREDLPT